MDFLDKWIYKLTGPKIPVFNVEIAEEDGKVKAFTFSKWLRRANSLMETWHVKGASIEEGEGRITYTDESGLTQPCFATYKGKTHDLYVTPRSYPSVEKIIGAGAMMDDIAESMDMGKSMKNMLIGCVIGIMLGWLIIGPMLNTVFS